MLLAATRLDGVDAIPLSFGLQGGVELLASPSGMDLSDASVMYADEDGFLDEWGVEYGDGVGFH